MSAQLADGERRSSSASGRRAPRRRSGRRVAAAVRRPPPRPRGHPAQAFEGLNGGPPGEAAGSDARDDGSQRPDRRQAGGRSRRRSARSSAAQLRGVRCPAVRDGERARGHRARDRARARRVPAGDDDQLRRQPHFDPRRGRGACVRDRDVRGRARARDAAVVSLRKPKTMRLELSGSLLGVTAKDVIPGDRAHRRRRRRRARGRVRGRGRARAADGRAHDHLQHVDRGRRAGGDDRP